ncbi:MAG: Si-specific NAD(P)(+) transhydrogenase [candidate division Zixibacteria bacterium]|nr:Si-specific NAD(P)(+) transhydrogenase [candidate division Zixibacteria bacterium]
MYDYDLIVIGTGPAGQKAAIAAAKFGKKVAIIEKRMVVGGVCINTGTIPSKTIREAVINLTGYAERAFYGLAYRVKENITIEDLLYRCNMVIVREIEVINAHLMRNGVEVLFGNGAFIDSHTIRYSNPNGEYQVTADKVIIAVGTKPYHPNEITVDNKTVLDSDSILQLRRLPKSLTVIGGGVIGMEYASIFATLGIPITLIDKRTRLLKFIDSEIVDSLINQMREAGVTFMLGEEINAINKRDDPIDETEINLKSAKTIRSDMILLSSGRRGNVNELNLEAAGLKADENGIIAVDRHYRTSTDNIYAVGDVIGFPSLASTSMEQGRQAAFHAFNYSCPLLPGLFPYGIYSIPEISYVGENEETLTQKGIPYQTGIARYQETARGQILGDFTGLLKLIVNRETNKLLGVHAIGTGATELIHIGQSVIALGGTIDYLVDSVFNYPTLAECYKIAALDVYNKSR